MDTELLLEGAKKLAAGQALGLTPEQTLVLIQREMKRQQRENPAVTQEYLLDQMLKANVEANQIAPAELKGRKPLDTAAVDAVVGLSQDDFQVIGANDRDADRSGREARAEGRETERVEDNKSRLAKRVDGSRDAQGRRVFENEISGYEPSAREVAMAIEGESGTAGVREALSRLQGANQAATSWLRPGGLKGAAAVEGRLEDSLSAWAGAGSANVQRNADASLGRELVRRDSQRFDPVSEAAKLNNLQASQEANSIRREIAQGSILGGQGFRGQEILNQIPTRKQQMNFRTARQAADVETKEGLYIDPITGNPVEVNEPATTAIAGTNTPDTAQKLNAPKQSSSISWVAQQMPQPNAFESSGGDMPQVDIGGPTQLFAERLKGLRGVGPGLQGISSNVRSVGEFEKAINYVINAGNANNMQWRRAIEEELPDGRIARRTERVDDPGAEEVMNLLRYTPAEKRALAGALYQLETARGAGANDAVSAAYFARQPSPRDVSDIRFDSPDAMINPNLGEASAPVARISPKTQLERQLIRPQLAQLDDPMARDPQMGQIRGERSRIFRKAPPNVSPADLDAHFLAEEQKIAQMNKAPVNTDRTRQKTVKAKLAVERQARDERNRAEAAKIEAAGMSQAQSDFNRRVREDKLLDESRPSRRIVGRPF